MGSPKATVPPRPSRPSSSLSPTPASRNTGTPTTLPSPARSPGVLSRTATTPPSTATSSTLPSTATTSTPSTTTSTTTRTTTPTTASVLLTSTTETKRLVSLL